MTRVGAWVVLVLLAGCAAVHARFPDGTECTEVATLHATAECLDDHGQRAAVTGGGLGAGWDAIASVILAVVAHFW